MINNPQSLPIDMLFGIEDIDFINALNDKKSDIFVDGKLAKRLHDIPGDDSSRQVIIIPLEKSIISVEEPADDYQFDFEFFLSTIKFTK